MFSPLRSTVMAAFALLAAAVASPAMAVPLTTDLVSGNYLFHIDPSSGCAATASGGNSANTPNCSTIEWVAVANGFKVQAAGGGGGFFETSVAGPSNFADVTLFFTVTSLNGSFLSGVDISIDSVGRFSSVTDTIPTGNYADGTFTQPASGTDNVSTTRTASKTFSGTGTSSVTIKADIKASSTSGTAGVTSVTQTFTTVPEPATLALLMTAVGPLLLARRRRRG